jgi:hypothetical protein
MPPFADPIVWFRLRAKRCTSVERGRALRAESGLGRILVAALTT